MIGLASYINVVRYFKKRSVRCGIKMAMKFKILTQNCTKEEFSCRVRTRDLPISGLTPQTTWPSWQLLQNVQKMPYKLKNHDGRPETLKERHQFSAKNTKDWEKNDPCKSQNWPLVNNPQFLSYPHDKKKKNIGVTGIWTCNHRLLDRCLSHHGHPGWYLETWKKCFIKYKSWINEWLACLPVMPHLPFLSAESFSSALHVVPEEKKKRGEADFFQKRMKVVLGAYHWVLGLGSAQHFSQTDGLMDDRTDRQMDRQTYTF